jgi:hypothetical protein
MEALKAINHMDYMSHDALQAPYPSRLLTEGFSGLWERLIDPTAVIERSHPNLPSMSHTLQVPSFDTVAILKRTKKIGWLKEL